MDFAGLTGGRPCFGDDIRAILSRFASDPAGGYALGYDAPPGSFDNKFHRVKVTCERKGVKIEVRQRYYAFPDARPPMAHAQDALLAAVGNPFDDPQIGLRVTAAPVSGAQKAMHLKVRIDPADLFLREEGGVFTGHITAWVAGNTQDFPIDNATTKVRVMVYDHSTGAVGSLTAPVAAS